MHDRASQQLAAQATSQPVFMAHGLQDPVVPYAAGEMSAALLRELGFAVDWHRYPMPHSVCAEEIRDLGDWMSRRFT
jgi:phospholipase/carboxylesterase